MLPDSLKDSSLHSLTERKLVGTKQNSFHTTTLTHSHVGATTTSQPTHQSGTSPIILAVTMTPSPKRVERGDDYHPRDSLVPAYDPLCYLLLGPAYASSLAPVQ